MSFIVTKAVYEHSQAKGAARLVLLALARACVNEKIERGDPAIAYLSQNTLAKQCNCSRASVQTALATLKELGEIEVVGKREYGKYKDTIEHEIMLEIEPSW